VAYGVSCIADFIGVIMKKPFLLLWRNRRMIKQTTMHDIRARYAGSYMGLVWAVLYPLLFLACYAVIYIFVFQMRYQSMGNVEYVMLIFSGLVPFIGVQEALAYGTGCVVANANLMKNTLFPIELVPVKTLLATQPTQISGFLLIVICLSFMGKLTPYVLLLPLAWIMQMLFDLGIIWIFSSLNVLFRDLQNIVGILIIFLMMISPIAYPAEIVPDNLRGFLGANPLYYMISTYQDILLMGRFPRIGLVVPFIAMSFIVFWIGYFFFSKMKKVFLDNV
jgi:lipopolysaccharide transport system permease protein